MESPYKPPQEWQEQQIHNFSSLRYKIECNKESWGRACLANFVCTLTSTRHISPEMSAEFEKEF